MMNQTEETKLLEQIEKWNDADEFSRCIEAIEAIPEQERGYLMTVKLSRAYSNLAVLGNHGVHGTDGEVDGDLIRHAIDLLESVRTQGENDPYWNSRMGYSCLMAYSSAATAYFAMEDPEVGLESRTTLMEGEDGIPFAENTDLRGEILLYPGVFGEESFFCRLPGGEEVNFYQVIPLYWEELQYKLEHGSDSLLDLCPDESLEVINPHRLNVVTDREKISYDPAEMDNAADQIKKIQELHLPVDELDACNLMAFFLGWAMKRGQMSNPFISGYREIVEAVQSGKEPDLRVFILDNLDGKLSTQFFDRRGSGFAQWYAQDNRSNPYVYRRDCRNIVLAKLQDRVWNSATEEEAAYLLLPYTEKNRQSVEHLLDERFQQYLEAEFVDDPEERVARAAEGKPAVIPDWDGPLFCYASDRVAQDGCKVQIMDRLIPEREDMGWESGWAFYSGDEGDVYGEGDEYYELHCGFYDIRDICRIDPDIIPFLNLPYGTMQMRGEDGAWYEVIRDDEGEEET